MVIIDVSYILNSLHFFSKFSHCSTVNHFVVQQAVVAMARDTPLPHQDLQLYTGLAAVCHLSSSFLILLLLLLLLLLFLLFLLLFVMAVHVIYPLQAPHLLILPPVTHLMSQTRLFTIHVQYIDIYCFGT